MKSTTSTIEPAQFRNVMGHFASGVTVITYHRGGVPAGMTANAFMSVSMNPPLILVSVRETSQFIGHVGLGSYYGVNILAEHQQDLSLHFGGRSIEGLEVPFDRTLAAPLIKDSLAHLVARVVDIHAAGDHLLYIAQVEHLRCGEEAKPLIYYSGSYKQIRTHDPVQWSSEFGW